MQRTVGEGLRKVAGRSCATCLGCDVIVRRVGRAMPALLQMLSRARPLFEQSGIGGGPDEAKKDVRKGQGKLYEGY